MSPPEAEITELPASPGARLRRERESRGMSEQQAAEAMNLDPVILDYIETNNFAALGAPVFVKGHLRRYAGMLGLAEDEILAMYERSKQQLREPSLVPKSRLEMAPVRGKPRWPFVVGGAVSFVVASALIAYLSENGLPWRTSSTDDAAAPAQQGESGALPTATGETTTATPEASTSTDTSTGPAPAATGPAPVSSSPTAVTPPGAAATAAASPPLQPGQVSLQLRFAADSWVEVFDGSGKAVLYDLGKAGSERTLTATAPLSVTLGDARGVTVAVNGRALPPPPRAAGETLARFSVGADGNVR